ncbi:hypothetical protein VXS06_14450 [Photobacterium toruni]|uniref:Phage tail sheath protein n=1 Tax=Photobacterium toruni TaxID=1935446 RepID=A0ABU6L9I3_9GAMM|nr:hypothetical protein [Photobacterium toruni]
MDSSIPFTQSNVAEVAVAPINADATLSAGGAGNRLIFAGLTISSKGKPFEVLSVNSDNYKALLGKVYHPSLGKVSEPLRHISDAVKGGNGLVVRVVPDDAKYPVLKLATVTKGKTATLATSAQPFGMSVELGESEKLAFFIEDGAVSDNRALEIKQADADMYGAGMFEVLVYETDLTGFETVLEKHIVSTNPEALNDMGLPAYICTVLESQSKTIRAVIAHDLTELPIVAKTKFVGGTEGNIKSISSGQYDKALAVLKATVTQFTHILGLGCYEPAVIKSLINIANGRRVSGFFDLDPRLSYEQAVQAKIDLSIGDERACFYHMPFSCVDPTYRCRSVWGLSGIIFTAKAKGVMKTSPTGGWHYTPAGEERALITRQGLRQLESAGVPDYEKMYKVRINKLATNKAGYLFVDDSLTSYVRENYLRFEQVVSVTDAVSRDFIELANALKHNPDGVTYDGLTRGMTRILESYYTSGALVTPTHPEIDGKEPYKLIVKKTDKDAWEISFALSITGSGRRFMAKPILIA